MIRLFAMMILCCAAFTPARSLAEPSQHPDAAREAAFKMLRYSVRSDRDFAALIAPKSRPVRNKDVEGDGLTRADDAHWSRVHEARLLAQRIRAWANDDLDADGVVTESELRAVHLFAASQPIRSGGVSLEKTPEQIAEFLNKRIAKSLAADRDGDKRVTFEEAQHAARTSLRNSKNKTRANSTFEIFEVFDANQDGVILRAEVDAALLSLLEEFDVDQSGRLERSEVKALQGEAQRVQQARNARARKERVLKAAVERCQPPLAPRGARLLDLEIFGGAALSSVTISDGFAVTTTGDIEIEPGEEPLFLSVRAPRRSTDLILRFTGAVDRVVGVALPKDGVGVVGLSPAALHRYAAKNCPPAPRKRMELETPQIIEAMFGQAPETSFRAERLGALMLPSGAETARPRRNGRVELDLLGAAAPIWRQFLKDRPGGLIAIDPSSVSSPLEARRYKVLPGMAGLALLAETGAVRVKRQPGWGARTLRNQADGSVMLGGARIYGGSRDVLIADGRFYKLDPRRVWREYLPLQIEILKKIRIPHGLSRREKDVQFVLAPGAPEADPDWVPFRGTRPRQ